MLVDFLEDSSDVKTSAARKMNTLKAWANTLDGLNTKPAKGRRKDLRRLDEAIRTMMKSAFG
jgi:hypothetical protein